MTKTKSLNITKSIFLLLGLLAIVSCNDGKKTYYEVKNDKVIYHAVFRKGQEYYAKAHLTAQFVKGADATTFKEISKQYGADATNVFYKATQLKDRDPLSFEVISRFITTDKFGVYLENKLIKNSDGLSFKFLNHRYAMDQNQVYYFSLNKYSVLKNVAIKTFKPINNYYAKDTNHVYFAMHLIRKAKSNSFEVLGFNYAKDSKNVYFKNNLMQVDYDSFRVLDNIILNKKLDATVFAEDKTFYYRDSISVKK